MMMMMLVMMMMMMSLCLSDDDAGDDDDDDDDDDFSLREKCPDAFTNGGWHPRTPRRCNKPRNLIPSALSLQLRDLKMRNNHEVDSHQVAAQRQVVPLRARPNAGTEPSPIRHSIHAA